MIDALIKIIQTPELAECFYLGMTISFTLGVAFLVGVYKVATKLSFSENRKDVQDFLKWSCR